MRLTCVPRQVSSISFPVLLDKGNVGNQVSGFPGKYCFLLDISLIFPLMWFFLHLTPSLGFTFSLQSTFYTQSAVRSLRFTLTENEHTIWALLLSLLALTTIFQQNYHNN